MEQVDEAMTALRRNVEEWKGQLTKAEAMPGPIGQRLAAALRAWIAEAEDIIADSGH